MRNWTLVLALLAALALAACGGDGDDTTDSEGGDDYTAQAEAICQDAAEDLAAINLDLGIDITPERSAEKWAEIAPLRAASAEDLRAIEAPEDAGPEWDEFVAASEEQAKTAEEQLAAFEDGDQEAIDKANAAAAEASDARQKAAEAAGLSTCAAVLPDDDQAAAEEVLLQFTTTNDPATSCEYENADAYVTEPFVEDGFGGIDKCVSEQKKVEGDLPTDIEVEETTGYDDTVASVMYADVGGEFDGEPTQAILYYVDDAWRLYSIGPAS